MEALEFVIDRWAICSPDLGSLSSTGTLEFNTHTQDSWNPDTSFLPKLFGRRLSRLSRMALFVCHHALGDDSDISSVFCSRYGEYQNSYQALRSIVDKDLVSPLAFSHSVHSTAQGLFSILEKNRQAGVTLAGGDDVFENAVVKACAMLYSGMARVLVVYHEDVLPEFYAETLSQVPQPLAMALVVKRQGDGRQCRLDFESAHHQGNSETTLNGPHAFNIARLLMGGGGTSAVTGPRLDWNWCVGAA